MKIITIGRSSDNDIHINDSLISRTHCQIIQDDNGHFRLIDTNSKNGTYVNGSLCRGEVRLNKSDIVRIGNTTLPWQTYFNDIKGTRTVGTNYPKDINTVKIGRGKDNDIVVNDSFVSSSHCQIIKDACGYAIVDTNSKNGTYVNGIKIHGSIRLQQTDIVRIGNTTLPWQNYFAQSIKVPISGTSVYDENPPVSPNPIAPNPTAQQSGLGTIALILSLIGAVILIYCAIRVMRWGIFALIGNASTYMLVSGGINILALILANIADYKEYKDSDAADMAEWISGFCIIAVIAFYLWIRFGDPSVLNPFSGLFK